jgi:hypothetical protein
MDASVLAGVGLVAAMGISQIRARQAAAARRAAAAREERAAAVRAARALAGRGKWEPLVRAGWLPRVGPAVADPGNPGQRLALVTDPHGLRGHGPGARLLIAVNATPGPDGTRTAHALPVPAHFTDPVAAAAWTYDDPDHPVRTTRSVYATLTRRT